MGRDDGQAVTALVPTEQDIVPFYGHDLVAVRLPDGRIAAVLRWLCDGLGVNIQSQMRHIRGRAVLADHFIRKRQTFMPMPADTTADTTAAAVIIEQITDLTAVINLLREHLETLLALPVQVADLSVQVGETRTLVESLAARQDTTETHLAAVDARTQRLTPAHARAVQEMVNRIVRETRHSATPFTYATIYGKLKTRFQAGSYNEIADSRFDELIAWLREALSNATNGEAPEQGSLF